jgi:Rha family phage regulatory protein
MENAMQVQVPQARPQVFVLDNRVYAHSRKVADVFGKKHFHVLREIERIQRSEKGCGFNESNFGLVKYPDAKGELRPAYNLTRDGFALLAFSFTGRRALRFKLAYIAEFNRMEQELRQAGTPPFGKGGPGGISLPPPAPAVAVNSPLPLGEGKGEGSFGPIVPKYIALLEAHVALLTRSALAAPSAFPAPRTRRNVTFVEREKIRAQWSAGRGTAEIAAETGRHPSTVDKLFRSFRKEA